MEKLFKKYFEGKTSPSEEKDLWNFVSRTPENEKSFRDADNVWRQNHIPSNGMEREFYSISREIRSRRKRSICTRISAVAASVAIAASVGFSYFRVKTSFYETKSGSIQELVLPDGTSVSLNSGSTLQYSAGRLSHNRQVFLSGEAYFDVFHDEDHPFVVQTEDFQISVLGTKFTVSDYPEDMFSHIILTEGSIMLNTGTEHRTLVPGDKIICDGEKIFESVSDTSNVCQWTSDIISYDNIELGDFINRLSREFNAHIELKAVGFAHESFRASFSRSDSVETILETVCNIFPLKIRTKDNTYSLIYTNNN